MCVCNCVDESLGLLVLALFQKHAATRSVAATSAVGGLPETHRNTMVELRLCRVVALIRLGMQRSSPQS